jgi:predicted ATPase
LKAAALDRVADARERRRKAIVFVTGVPGAGKTLVGLNVTTRHGEGQVTHRAAI